MSLPETFPTPERMARALASYLDCPRRIRSEVLACFDSAPHVETIERFRHEHLTRAPVPSESFKVHEGYYPGDASFAADGANRRFVAALKMARWV